MKIFQHLIKFQQSRPKAAKRISNRSPGLFVVLLVLSLAGCSKSEPPTPTNTTRLKSAHKKTKSSKDQQGNEARRDRTTEKIRLSQASYKSPIRLTPLPVDQFPKVVPDNGAARGYATILESLGSGVAAVDFDADGWPDVLVGGGGDLPDKQFVGKAIHVLRNRITGFQRVTSVAGMHKTQTFHHAMAAHDFNNDGFPDLLVTGYGCVQLFENMGDGTFVDVTSDSQLNCPTWTASAAWADFNQDGAPDVYITGYVNWSWDNDPPCFAADGIRQDNCSPRLFKAVPDFLFYGNGDGTFDDVTAEMKIKPDGKSLGVVCADIDSDSDIDIYVGNDVMMNYVYRNNDGTGFIDWSVASGAGVSQRGSPDASMGVAVADYNLDGKFDVWAANFEMESFALYHNHGSMMFRHMSETTGVTAIGGQYVGWGSVFTDLDLDGDPDMAVCNGHVVQFPEHSPAQQRMVILENLNGQRFEEVTSQVGEAVMKPLNGRGLAVTDWNRDGRIDLVTSPIHSAAQILTNESKTKNNWLCLKLIGTQTSRHPVGCIVELRTNKRSYLQQVTGGSSYASTNWGELTFGIPETEQLKSITIRWPGQGVDAAQSLTPASLNSHLTIVQPTSPELKLSVFGQHF